MTARSIFGKPGGGKSYSVTSFLSTEAVARGRQLFTNVKGTNPSAISEYLNWICDFSLSRTDKNFRNLPFNVAKSRAETIVGRLRGIQFETNRPLLTQNERKLFNILKDRANKEGKPELISGNYDFSSLITILPRNPRYIHDEHGAQTERTNYFLWYHPDYADKCLIRPNSVVVIDECSLVFINIAKDAKFNDQTNMFISMHRHAGIDLYFIAQNSKQIPQNFREQFAQTYYCKQSTAFGKLGAGSFNLYIYEGSRLSSELEKDIRKGIVDQSPITERLNNRVFELYVSYDNQSGIEAPSASTATVFDDKILFIPLRYWNYILPIAGATCLYFIGSSLMSMFSSPKPVHPVSASASAPALAASAPASAASSPQLQTVRLSSSSVEEFSTDFRLVGIYTINNREVALLKHPQIGYRYVTDFSYSSMTSMPEIMYRGKIVNHFTGNFPEVKEKISENKNEQKSNHIGL